MARGGVSLKLEAKMQQFVSEATKAGRSITDLQKKTKVLTGELARATRQSEKQGKELQETARKAGRAFGKGGPAMTGLAQYVAGVLSIGAAIGTLKGSYQTWLANIRETASEAKKASDEMIALAALQAGGTKAERVRRASELAMQYGVTQRGVAYDTVQALQSALGGDFEAGMEAGRTVFAATQLGIPLEFAKELEVLGATQGQARAAALRRAYAAGQASARDPAVLARAAPAMKWFEDKDIGFAMAGVLAGTLSPEKLEVYTRQAGMALSGVGAGAKPGKKGAPSLWQRLGVEQATQLERLSALAAAGIVTPEQLTTAGFTEIRQREALAGLIPNVADVTRIAAEVRRRNVPGMLAGERVGVEAELPQARVAREIGILTAAVKDEQAFGSRAMRALEQDRYDRARALVLRRQGIESLLGWDLIDEQGRAGLLSELLYYVRKGGVKLADVPRGEPDVSEFTVAIKGILDNTKRIADNTVEQRRSAQPTPATMTAEAREGENTAPVGGHSKPGALQGGP